MTSVGSSTPGPLNPGNVVSAALRLCRDRFKTYFGLSLKATLWLLVPIYGWAKYIMYSGVISRLAFRELMNQPETPDQAFAQTQPKLWSYLWMGILVLLIYLAAYIVLAIGIGILGVAAGIGLGALLGSVLGEAGGIVVGIITAVLVGLGVLLGLLWIIGRMFIAEVPMSVESPTLATDSISRSWNLTKKSIVRIQFVVLAAYLVTIPILLVMNFAPQIALFSTEPGSPTYWLIYGIGLLLSLAGNLMTMPFWQVVKGVLYYDLRSRREGLDLQI